MFNLNTYATQLSDEDRNKFQTPNEGGLLGSKDYFQSLISNAEYIERTSSCQISVMFDHYTEQLGEFDRIFIEKDWGLNPSQTHQTPVR